MLRCAAYTLRISSKMSVIPLFHRNKNTFDSFEIVSAYIMCARICAMVLGWYLLVSCQSIFLIVVGLICCCSWCCLLPLLSLRPKSNLSFSKWIFFPLFCQSSPAFHHRLSSLCVLWNVYSQTPMRVMYGYGK